MISIERILAQALRDPTAFAMLRGALTNSLAVANPHYRQIMEFAAEFYDQYRSLPRQGDFEIWLGNLQDPQRSIINSTLGQLSGFPAEDWNVEYFAGEVTNTLKSVAARTAVARLGSMVPDVPVDSIRTLADEVDKVTPTTIHGLLSLAKVEDVISTHEEQTITSCSGIQTLDRLIGGFRQGELVYVMADTSVGKTTMLVNIGRASALFGANVFHITFELSGENTLRRYVRGIAEVDRDELRKDPGFAVDKVKKWLRLAKGSVQILYMPPYEVGATELTSLVDQYEQLHGKLDLLILDYLDLMKPPKGNYTSAYEPLGQLSHQVRNLGQAHKATSLSATQASRASHNQRHLRLDTIGDSYRKAQAADITLGISQVPEEFEAFQARLGVLKMRENPGKGIEIPLYCNLDLMLMADLDSPNSQRLIKKYGHRAEPFRFDENGDGK